MTHTLCGCALSVWLRMESVSLTGSPGPPPPFPQSPGCGTSPAGKHEQQPCAGSPPRVARSELVLFTGKFGTKLPITPSSPQDSRAEMWGHSMLPPSLGAWEGLGPPTISHHYPESSQVAELRCGGLACTPTPSPRVREGLEMPSISLKHLLKPPACSHGHMLLAELDLSPGCPFPPPSFACSTIRWP